MNLLLKLHILFVCCFIGFGVSFGQVNLVPNPSFEMYDTCPNSTSEINYLSYWKSYKNSPDFFASCATYPPMSLPYNDFGYQQTHSGNSYTGLWCYFPNTYYREIIGIQLTAPLIIGQKYFVKFNANLSNSTNAAINKLGLKFSNIDYSINQNPPINNSADLISIGYIIDTVNWTAVFGSFIADSAYGYAILGNFFDDLHSPRVVYPNTPDTSSYYYLDDICVSTDSIFALNYIWTGITENNLQIDVSVYPNPATSTITVETKNTILKNIHIYNVLGGEILNQVQHDERATIDISGFANGIYFMEVQTVNGIIRQKLVKQ